MMIAKSIIVALLAALQAEAFVSTSKTTLNNGKALFMTADENDRRSFLNQAALLIPASLGLANANVQPASAQVFFDPAVYGDQELRGSAVNSLKEAVRRAILQDPKLAPSFYQLALLDGLSFDAASKDFGPDGRIVQAVLSSKDDSQYTKNLQKACLTLIQACQDLKRLTSIGIADAVALGGVAAIESVGGPFLSVQLGRTDAPKNAKLSPLNIKVFSGSVSPGDVRAAFERSGLTEREMTALLGTLMTLEAVQKTRTTADWKASAKPKFVEPGKMGRASDFKPLTEQDIADLENDDAEEDEGWYIAESFGTRDEQFGAKVGADISEKNFNKFLKELYTDGSSKSRKQGDISRFGWYGQLLLDKQSPTTEAWVSKYAGSYLNFNKDLGVAFNAVTQLGAEFTGGKYENLLKNRKRKTLNDDDLGFKL